jgi:hypothetical protein
MSSVSSKIKVFSRKCGLNWKFLGAICMFTVVPCLLFVLYLGVSNVLRDESFFARIPEQYVSTPLAQCRANISVKNEKSQFTYDMGNSFSVTVTNQGTETKTFNIKDEIWEDRDCNGIEDASECSKFGLPSPCSWGYTNAGSKSWNSVVIEAGKSVTLNWSRFGWKANYCYVHGPYVASIPFSSANVCWRGNTQTWPEANAGNMVWKTNQASFKTTSQATTLSTSTASCRADVSVTNQKDIINYGTGNTFSVVVRNLSNSKKTYEVRDEIWEDRDCNGIDDASECSKFGLPNPCNWGYTSGGVKVWSNVVVEAGASATLSWINFGWKSNYCYVHGPYVASTPYSSSNVCWKGNSGTWAEANAGNMIWRRNQSSFRIVPDASKNTAYGFTTHILFNSLEPSMKSTQTTAVFEQDIDMLTADYTNLRMIRVAVAGWDVLTNASQTKINWRSAQLDALAADLNYASSKGFKIVLTTSPWECSCAWVPTGVPDCCNNQPFDQTAYNDYVRRYFGGLATELQRRGALDAVTYWSLWNESDQSCFTKYVGEEVTGTGTGKYPQTCYSTNGGTMLGANTYVKSDHYLNAFASAFAAGSSAVKAVQPNAKVMAHAAVYPVSDWDANGKFFSKVNSSIDILGISSYPIRTVYEQDLTALIVDTYKQKFGKPVFVLETGYHDPAGSTYRDANGVLSMSCISDAPENTDPSLNTRALTMIAQLSKLNNHADAVFIYQLRDDIYNKLECPAYGFLKPDATKKPSYSVIKDYINANGKLP